MSYLKSHIIFPKVCNHCTPNTMSQFPKGNTMKFVANTVFWSYHLSPLYSALVLSWLPSATETDKGLVGVLWHPSLRTVVLSRKLWVLPLCTYLLLWTPVTLMVWKAATPTMACMDTWGASVSLPIPLQCLRPLFPLGIIRFFCVWGDVLEYRVHHK